MVMNENVNTIENGVTPSNKENAGANPTPPGSQPGQPKPTRGPAHRSAQDAREATDVSQTRQLVEFIMGDTEVADPLKQKGFDTQRFTQVLDWCDGADEKFDERQEAIARQTEQTALVQQLFDTAVLAYVDFRETARTSFEDKAALQALNVTEPVPSDRQQFLRQARSAYTNGQRERYQSVLKVNGYPTATLGGELAALKTLRDAIKQQGKTEAAAKKATAARRKAVEPVRKFRQKVVRIARRVFRTQPEQLQKLDF